MICFIKGVFIAGVIVAALCLIAVMVQEFNTQTSGADGERQEYPIKVPSNSRPILSPCDLEK